MAERYLCADCLKCSHRLWALLTSSGSVVRVATSATEARASSVDLRHRLCLPHHASLAEFESANRALRLTHQLPTGPGCRAQIQGCGSASHLLRRPVQYWRLVIGGASCRYLWHRCCGSWPTLLARHRAMKFEFGCGLSPFVADPGQ